VATLEALGGSSDQIPLSCTLHVERAVSPCSRVIQGQTLTAKVADEGPLSESVVKRNFGSLLLIVVFL